MHNLQDILQKCSKGDRRSQRLLLDNYSRYLHSVALRYARDRAEAMDITQEAWIKVFNNLDKYRHEGKFEGWIARITINIALRNIKKHHKEVLVSSHEQHKPCQGPSALEDMHYDELLNVVNSLPDALKTVFKLIAIDGLRHQEVASLLSIAESTSRVYYTRARKQLIVMIDSLENTPVHGR